MKPIAIIWIITIVVLSVFFLVTDLAYSQGINTRTISPKFPTLITLSKASITTLYFPQIVSSAFALGLVMEAKDGKNKTAGSVVGFRSEDKRLFVLHSLSDDLNTPLTVLMDGQLYTFQLVCGKDPDVAVTLRTSGNYSASAPVEVKPEMVVKMRPDFDPELLVDLVDRAENNELLQVSYPQGYEHYQKMMTNYVSDDGYVKTVVGQVHKFGNEDAVVILGEVRNLTDAPLKFDLFHVSVAINQELRPLTLLLPKRVIPGNGTVHFKALIMGDKDGSRAGLSLENEYRLIVDTGRPRKATPETSPSPSVIPLEQVPPIPLLPPKKGSKP